MKEWYLLNDRTRPNLAGGFESEQFEAYKNDVFAEMLETGLAEDVLLCSSDLSVKKPTKVIMQGRLGETQLKTMQRTVLLPIGTIKAGNYVYYRDCYWLATGVPDNNGIYEKCTLDLCQYEMKWQNCKGKIVSRWINAVSASKYDMGENSYGNIITTSNNFTLLTPADEETSELYEKRVFLDVNDPPQKVFKITRDDGILYQYGSNGAVYSFITTKEELNIEKDNQELGICDYVEPDNPIESNNKHYDIIGKDNLVCTRTNTYIAKITDDSDNDIQSNYEWNVITDCQYLDQKIVDGNLTLSTQNRKSIGHLVTVELLVDSVPVKTMDIQIVSFL